MRWLIFSKQVLARLRDVSLWQSLQTVAISLLLIMMLSLYPSRFNSYVMGFCLGFALVHRLLLPSQKGVNATFRYALPYLVLYGILLGSCFLFGNISASLSYCGRYFCLWLIPLVFMGMTPSFFTARRLRIFAFCLVVGAMIGVFWKFYALSQAYFSNRLTVYREQGFWFSIRHMFEYLRYQYFIQEIGCRLTHPAFEAFFELMALVVVLQAWIKRDRFFAHGYGKILAVFVAGSIIFNLLFLCTKTAAFLCVCSIFALWVYALCKKRYVFAGVSAVGILLCIGVLTHHSPQEVFSRFSRTIYASRDFLRGGDTEKDSSFIPRVRSYKVSWEMFKEKPLTGSGIFYTQEFEKRYEKYYPQEKPLTHPHNQLLMMLNACGVMGGLVFVWLFLCILRDVWHRKSLFWWIWFANLLAICTIDVLFNRTIGFIYLCGFHGILFCELTSDFLHSEDAHKPLIFEKSAEGV